MSILYESVITDTTGLSDIAIDMIAKQKELIDAIKKKYPNCIIVVNNTVYDGKWLTDLAKPKTMLHIELTFDDSDILFDIEWDESFSSGWRTRSFDMLVSMDIGSNCRWPMGSCYSDIDIMLNEIDEVLKTTS